MLCPLRESTLALGKVFPYFPPVVPLFSHFPMLGTHEKAGVMTHACDFVIFECILTHLPGFIHV